MAGACRGTLRARLGLGAWDPFRPPVLPAVSRARGVRPPCISTDTEFVAFRIVHDDEVDRVVRVVMSGPALHPGAQVDQLGNLRLDDLDLLLHRQRVVPAGGKKNQVQPVLAHLRLRQMQTRSAGAARPGRKSDRRSRSAQLAGSGSARARSYPAHSAVPAGSQAPVSKTGPAAPGHSRRSLAARTSRPHASPASRQRPHRARYGTCRRMAEQLRQYADSDRDHRLPTTKRGREATSRAWTVPAALIASGRCVR